MTDRKILSPQQRNALNAMLEEHGVASVLRAIDGWCGMKGNHATTNLARAQWYYIGREVSKTERLTNTLKSFAETE